MRCAIRASLVFVLSISTAPPTVRADEARTPAAESQVLALCTTSGGLTSLGVGRFRAETGGMRAVAPMMRTDTATLSFVYRGPSRDVAPLANGEVRRQIGLKLRAMDSCNVVYVMWQEGAAPGVFVSVKFNPGKSSHRDCGANGYINVAREEGTAPPMMTAFTSHTLRAVLDGQHLEVTADGRLAWRGLLPPEALTFDGPPGVRTDNGTFDFELAAGPPGPTRLCGTLQASIPD